MTLSVVLLIMELRTTENGIKLFRNPIKEIENLYDKTYSYNNKSINYINTVDIVF